MYNILPDTENRTLEEIELHFSDKTKKITDRNIAKINSESNNVNVDKTNQNEYDNHAFVNDV